MKGPYIDLTLPRSTPGNILYRVPPPPPGGADSSLNCRKCCMDDICTNVCTRTTLVNAGPNVGLLLAGASTGGGWGHPPILYGGGYISIRHTHTHTHAHTNARIVPSEELDLRGGTMRSGDPYRRPPKEFVCIPDFLPRVPDLLPRIPDLVRLNVCALRTSSQGFLTSS